MLFNDFFNEYPYRDIESLNLDFLIKMIRKLEEELINFVSLNTVTYADPIQWSITRQYKVNTVVVDPITGTAYLSTKPVPLGVPLTNTNYWTPIFDLNLLSANQNITTRDDGANILATFPSDPDDWLIWNNLLYIVIHEIHENEAYVEGYNIRRYTVEMFLKDYINDVISKINALAAKVGNLSNLTTTEKNTIVGAINELVTNINAVDTKVGDLANLTTTAKNNVVAALNELVTAIAAESTARTQADNAINGKIGNLANLDTTNKSNLVAAINEIFNQPATHELRTIYDYGYTSGSDITQYIQAFINDADASEIFLYDSGEFTIGNLNFSGVSSALNSIKYFTKTADCVVSGAGAIALGIATMSTEAANIRTTYSTGNCGYATRIVKNSDVTHTPNGNTINNLTLVDNINNANDGYYHWNLLAQSNIYSNTRAEDVVGYFQAHVHGDNENWALATENILYNGNEEHSTRGIEVSLTGDSGVSGRGGKRIGIHLVTNTTGGGFQADYGILISSGPNNINNGFLRGIQFEGGYSEYGIYAENTYTFVYGIDLSRANVQAASIKLGSGSNRCIQYNNVTLAEENLLGVDCFSIKKGNDKLSLNFLTGTPSGATPTTYIRVFWNGQQYFIPMYQ